MHPCPECGHDRIGTNRIRCRTCNRYNSRLRAAVNKTLRIAYPHEATAYRDNLAGPIADEITHDYRKAL